MPNGVADEPRDAEACSADASDGSIYRFYRLEFRYRHPCEWTILAENRWTHVGRKLTWRWFHPLRARQEEGPAYYAEPSCFILVRIYRCVCRKLGEKKPS